MDITLLYFNDCPNWKVAEKRLTLVAAERSDITITHQLVETAEQAERVGFLGSPSIQVGGVDMFAAPGARVGLTCRRYSTPGGYAGAPTTKQLRRSSPMYDRDTISEDRVTITKVRAAAIEEGRT